MEDTIYHIASETLPRFKKILRDVELLVLEDAEGLKGRTATQMFLNQIIEARVRSQKRTILFSGEKVKKLSHFRKDLKKTLRSGLIIEGQSF